MARIVFVALLVVFTLAPTHAVEPVAQSWTVDGVKREAQIAVPTSAKSTAAPVVFAFHGHGGTMSSAARSFKYHTHWPEAIVVYMQGLNTPGRLTDPEGKKPGWQHSLGDQGDRDLKFFDVVLASLKKDDKVDEKRIYSTGHSNGGGFTYLLWAARGEHFAAMAPSASAAATRQLSNLKPKPVLHVAGETDELVKYEWQKQTIETLKKLNGCSPTGQPWDVKLCTIYGSKTDTPVVTYIHPGDHKFPTTEVPPAIVKFFQQHAKK